MDHALRMAAAVLLILAVAGPGSTRAEGTETPGQPSTPPSARFEPPPPKVNPGTPVSIHPDPTALERALLDLNAAFLHDDPDAVRSALNRIETGSRRLTSDDPGRSSVVIAFDRGFHLALDRARELANGGQMDGAFDQLVWIQRSCRECHAAAKKDAARTGPAPAPSH